MENQHEKAVNRVHYGFGFFSIGVVVSPIAADASYISYGAMSKNRAWYPRVSRSPTSANSYR